jgi:hypothetical protein
MKHLAKIQLEFLKAARDWDSFSLEEQKEYLKRHPKSKRKLTAKPKLVKSIKDVHTALKGSKYNVSDNYANEILKLAISKANGSEINHDNILDAAKAFFKKII